MATVAIIQARMGSTRLPGKVLLRLKEKTVLEHVVQRVGSSETIDEIVIATTTLPIDDAIESEAYRLGIRSVRGSEDDVLSRYVGAATSARADIVVRITSDCPMIEPEIIEGIIALRNERQADYASNTLVRSFPRGLDAEVFTFDALCRAERESRHPEHREHVTPYLYRNPNRFTLADYVGDTDYSRYRWTLDTAEDWALVQRVYDELYVPGKLFHWGDGIRLMEEHPEIPRLNEHVEQKKLSDT